MIPDLIILRQAKLNRQRQQAHQRGMASREWNTARLLAKDNAALRIRPDGTYDMVLSDPDGILPTAFPGGK